MALYGVVFLGSTPIGAPLVGTFAQHLGARSAFFAAGLLAIVVAAGVLWTRARTGRSVERRPNPEQVAGVDGPEAVTA